MMKFDLLLSGYDAAFYRGWLGWSTVALLKTGFENILFDTGSFNDRPLLLTRVSEVGLRPEDVDLAVLSHLHFDHAMNLDLFPNARIVLHQAEREAFRHMPPDPAVPPYLFDALERHGRVDWVNGETLLAPGVRLIETPGHTPGSVSLVFSGDAGITVLAGDAIKTRRAYTAPDADVTTRRIRELADLIVPGHDLPFWKNGSVMDGYFDDVWIDPKGDPAKRICLRTLERGMRNELADRMWISPDREQA